MAELSHNLYSFEINDSFHVHHDTATARNGYRASVFEPKLPHKPILEQFQKTRSLQKGLRDHVRAVASEGENDARVMSAPVRPGTDPDSTQHTPNTSADLDPRLPDNISTIKRRANIGEEVNEGTVKLVSYTSMHQHHEYADGFFS
jgi:hypothetical protein